MRTTYVDVSQPEYKVDANDEFIVFSSVITGASTSWAFVDSGVSYTTPGRYSAHGKHRPRDDSGLRGANVDKNFDFVMHLVTDYGGCQKSHTKPRFLRLEGAGCEDERFESL